MISKKLKIIERKDLISKDVEAVWCNIFNDESESWLAQCMFRLTMLIV